MIVVMPGEDSKSVGPFKHNPGVDMNSTSVSAAVLWHRRVVEVSLERLAPYNGRVAKRIGSLYR